MQVDGETVRDLDRWIDPVQSRITLDGTVVLPRTGTAIVVFNKPRGFITTLSDPEGRPTVRDALPEPFASDRALRPVGRLDRASAGLLLFTDDTDVAERLLSPATKLEKEYRVKVRPALDLEALEAWRRGIDIGDETKTAPAQVEVEKVSPKSAVVRVTLKEGRNRQIRRMAEASGSRVEWLVRVRFGPIELGELAPGEARIADTLERRGLGLPAR